MDFDLGSEYRIRSVYFLTDDVFIGINSLASLTSIYSNTSPFVGASLAQGVEEVSSLSPVTFLTSLPFDSGSIEQLLGLKTDALNLNSMDFKTRYLRLRVESGDFQTGSTRKVITMCHENDRTCSKRNNGESI